MTGNRPSDAAIKKAGETLAAGDLAIASMTPREQAEAAWSPTSKYSIDELEDRIRIKRGLDPKHTKHVPSRRSA